MRKKGTKAKYARYKSEGRRAKNKKREAARREKKFAKNRKKRKLKDERFSNDSKTV